MTVTVTESVSETVAVTDAVLRVAIPEAPGHQVPHRDPGNRCSLALSLVAAAGRRRWLLSLVAASESETAIVTVAVTVNRDRQP